jgi:hypothetical protein
MKRAIFAIVIVFLFVFFGCSAKKPNLNQELYQAVTRNSYPRSIAVLPFGNQTDVDGVEDFVRVTFYSHLCAQPYKDIELQIVDQKLRRNKITDYKKLRKIPVKKLGRILNCDAVVFGEVTEFEKIFAGIYSQMAVGLSISIWDTRSGREIWADEHTERHHEGGIPLTLTEIPLITFRSGMVLRDDAKIQAADELSRLLTRRIPIPENFNYTYGAVDFNSSKGSFKYKSLKRLTKSSDRLVYSTKFKSLKRLTKKDDSEKIPEL